MATKKSKIIRLITPGLIFQSVLIAGGYGTGAELSEFFARPGGSLGGLIAMCTITLVSFSLVCAVTYEFARIFKTWDYRSFFKRLIGPFWVVFEICYLLLLLLVLSVVVAAGGANFVEVFGVSKWVGIILLCIGVAYLVIAGTKVLVKMLSFWSYVLYTVFIIFMIMCVAKFGSNIAEQISVVKEIKPGFVMGGFKYAFYNLACIPFMLYTITDMENRGEALTAGVFAGIIGIAPGIMLYIAMMGQYPAVMDVQVPINALFEKLNVRWFQVIFQIVLYGTFIETGSGFIKAVTDRLEGQFSTAANPRKWLVPVTTAVCLLLGIIISSFGLIGLVAKGYGTITWGFFIIYVIPILTIGVYKICKHSKA